MKQLSTRVWTVAVGLIWGRGRMGLTLLEVRVTLEMILGWRLRGSRWPHQEENQTII